METIKEELLDAFEKWCAEYVDPKELPLDFQRSEGMFSYDSIVTKVFWMGWLGGYGYGIEQGLALSRRQDSTIH